MPYIAQVAAGKLPHVNVYGNDYPTPDGTGIRDYIHVVDLAEGHLAALDYVNNHQGWDVFNLGTGHGISVLEMISSYEQANGQEIAYQIKGRRKGDIASCYTKVEKLQDLLQWRARYALNQMCQSSWLWQNMRYGSV
jgi:UDP-glucose 4-epimerase